MKSCLNLNYYYLYFWFWNVVLWCVFSFILEELPFFSIFFHFFSKISLPKFLPLRQLSTVYAFFPILEFTKQPNQHIVRRRRRHLNANVVTSHAFLIYFFPIFFSVKNSEYCLVGDIMPSPSVAHWLSRIVSVKNFQKVQY